MPEKAEKNKSGAGKFFLGAAIGAAVGAIASKFIKFDSGEEIEEDAAEACPKCEKSAKDCDCNKAKTVANETKKEPKKEAKKVADKK